MPQGVIIIVNWVTKPGLADGFIATLQKMFLETRLHRGFRTIRLLRDATAPDTFLMIQEWDDAQDFRTYVQFRNNTGDAERLLAMTDGPPKTSMWSVDPLASAEA